MEKIEKGNPLTQSADIVKQNIDVLKQLFPTIVKEGKIDIDELKALLDEEIETSEEYYRFSWAGKSDARRESNKPSTATLRPNKADRKNWDTTNNIYIEGDNLEVLKLLQKSYANKIKMIYIDPPYNTGKDFVYKDNYTDNLSNYLSITGQSDVEGRKLRTNPESDGRYHSNWLSMMLPRLKLAQNLLEDDGSIFISINDNEVHSLISVLNELFGEDNRISTLIWDKGHSAQAGIFKVYHEYVLVYSRNKDLVGVPNSSDNNLFEAGAMKKESSRHPLSEFTFPAGVRFEAPDGTEFKGTWGGTEKIILVNGRMIAEDRKTKYEVTIRAAYTQKNQMEQFFYGDKSTLIDSRGQKIDNFYFSSTGKIKIVKERGVYTPDTTLSYGTQSAASGELAKIFDLTDTPIDNPKPISMIKDFVSWFTDDNDIILDFFAGSGTTAHAVMKLNAEDGSDRKFICVQLPEPIIESSEAFKAGYSTIADLCKKRISLAGEIIIKESETDLFKQTSDKLDIGFKAFKLDSSNIHAWDGSVENFERNLLNAETNIKEGRSEDDVLFEILLKYGLDLTVPIVSKEVNACTVYSIGGGVLFICLSDNISTEVATAIGKWKLELQPATCRALFKDNGFNNDITKTNSIQILRQFGIEEANSI
jgi:adenine-specific DNA-methyltransferase